MLSFEPLLWKAREGKNTHTSLFRDRMGPACLFSVFSKADEQRSNRLANGINFEYSSCMGTERCHVTASP